MGSCFGLLTVTIERKDAANAPQKHAKQLNLKLPDPVRFLGF